jgi:F1F0 ATPase subunit 2
MTKIPSLLTAWLAGGIMGTIFFGGLWWTIRRGVSSQQPALWFLGSLLTRMSVALAGFYLMSAGDWERLVTCLLGFITARLAVMRLTGSKGERQCTLLPTR